MRATGLTHRISLDVIILLTSCTSSPVYCCFLPPALYLFSATHSLFPTLQECEPNTAVLHIAGRSTSDNVPLAVRYRWRLHLSIY